MRRKEKMSKSPRKGYIYRKSPSGRSKNTLHIKNSHRFYRSVKDEIYYILVYCLYILSIVSWTSMR